MREVFVDTNVLVRFYLPDDPIQTRRAKNLMGQCKEGRLRLVTGGPVLFEVAWVLGQVYKEPLDKVLDFFESLLAVPMLKILDADLVLQALELAQAKGVEFSDAYIAASARKLGIHEVATFDKRDFLRAGMELMEF